MSENTLLNHFKHLPRRQLQRELREITGIEQLYLWEFIGLGWILDNEPIRASKMLADRLGVKQGDVIGYRVLVGHVQGSAMGDLMNVETDEEPYPDPFKWLSANWCQTKYKPPYEFSTHIGSAFAWKMRTFADLAKTLKMPVEDLMRQCNGKTAPTKALVKGLSKELDIDESFLNRLADEVRKDLDRWIERIGSCPKEFLALKCDHWQGRFS
jgi:hypothetical protein